MLDTSSSERQSAYDSLQSMMLENFSNDPDETMSGLSASAAGLLNRDHFICDTSLASKTLGIFATIDCKLLVQFYFLLG
jgi:hypothetical protein